MWWTSTLESQLELLSAIFSGHGLTLRMTSLAAPEQYEVFRNGRQVAYLRLRHGMFSVEVPDSGGTTILTAYPAGDAQFEDSERLEMLTEAMHRILSFPVSPKSD